MKIRTKSNLAAVHANPNRKISADSPELRFMSAVCAQDIDAALAIFADKKLFGGVPSVIDAPYGRFEGLEGIRQFAGTFLSTFNAQKAFIVPVSQTRANGRAVTEMEIQFEADGEIDQVPMFVIGDLRTQDTLDELRIYCHCSFVPNLQAYRKPMFIPAHLEMGDPGLLTGAVREYYEALHHVPAVDVERILGSMSPSCKFGGYEPAVDEHVTADTPQAIREKFIHMSSYIPSCVGMRYETLIDDGVTCVIEWVHIVSRKGQQERARISISGVAAYERGEDGLLCGIRISDYAGFERTIDWSKTPVTKKEAQAINFVETFPAGVGRKPQS